MKITTTKENLTKALTVTTKAVTTSIAEARPILANVLFQTEGKRLKVTATDMDLYITSWFDGEIEEPGQAALRAKNFEYIIKNLPGENVTLEVMKKGHKVALTCGETSSELPIDDPTGFPSVPDVVKTGVEVDARALKAALTRVLPAAARPGSEPDRPFLAGVNFIVDGTKLRIVATDRFMLAYDSVDILPDSKIEDVKNFTVTLRALEELRKEIGTESGRKVTFSFAGKLIALRYAAVEIISNMFMQPYPDIRSKVSPMLASTVATASIDRKDLLGGLRLAQGYLDKGSEVIFLELDPANRPDKLILDASSKDLGSSTNPLPAKITGDAIKVKINPRMLQAGLAGIETETVEFQFVGPLSPIAISADKTGEHRFVAMPLRATDENG